MILVLFAVFLMVVAAVLPENRQSWKWTLRGVACALFALDSCQDEASSQGVVLPPALALWFELALERAGGLAPKQRDAARRFLRDTETSLAWLAAWLDASGDPPPDIAAAAQQAANSASALAAHCRPGRARAKAPAKEPPPEEDEATVRRAVDQVAKKHRSGTLLLVEEVRAAAGLPKARFDRAALTLGRLRSIVLHHHDHPHMVRDADRENMVHDEQRDVYYVGIAPR